jgi:hypothetical protein
MRGVTCGADFGVKHLYLEEEAVDGAADLAELGISPTPLVLSSPCETCLILLLAFSLNVRAESVVDKLAGSWKLNPAKSKLVSDIAEQTMKIEKIGSQRSESRSDHDEVREAPRRLSGSATEKGTAQAFGTGRAEIVTWRLEPLPSCGRASPVVNCA